MIDTWTAEALEVEIRARGGSVTLAGSIDGATLADTLGVTRRTLERWRDVGTGPRSYTVNGPSGRRFYLLADVAAYLNECAMPLPPVRADALEMAPMPVTEDAANDLPIVCTWAGVVGTPRAA